MGRNSSRLHWIVISSVSRSQSYNILQNFMLEITPKTIYKQVKSLIERNKESDLFHKAFLKPMEIALKTSPSEILPSGLHQVYKTDISLNSYQLKDFDSFEGLLSSQKKGVFSSDFLVENHYDNLISLIKNDSPNSLEIAICVCISEEDKSTFRRTLSSITDNMINLVKEGIDANKIGVFVILDGIV